MANSVLSVHHNTDSASARRAPVWRIAMAFAATMLMFVLLQVGLVLVIFGTEALEDETALLNNPASCILILATGQMWFCVASIALARTSAGSIRNRLRLRCPKLSISEHVYAVLGMVGLQLCIGGLLVLMDVDLGASIDAILQLTSNSKGLVFIALVVVAGLGPALGEEFICRGWLQTSLTGRWGARWGILVTSIFFGVLHLDLVQGCCAVLLGIYLGYVAELSNSTWTASICHGVGNSLIIILMTLCGSGMQSQSVALIQLIVAAPMFILAVHRLRPSRLSQKVGLVNEMPA